MNHLNSEDSGTSLSSRLSSVWPDNGMGVAAPEWYRELRYQEKIARKRLSVWRISLILSCLRPIDGRFPSRPKACLTRHGLIRAVCICWELAVLLRCPSLGKIRSRALSR